MDISASVTASGPLQTSTYIKLVVCESDEEELAFPEHALLRGGSPDLGTPSPTKTDVFLHIVEGTQMLIFYTG